MESGKMQSKQADRAGARLCLRLITLFVLTIGRVGAVDIIGYNEANACSNVGLGCYNIGPNVCCAFGGAIPSISIGSKPSNGVAVAYTGNIQNSCLTNICSGGGAGTLCCIEGSYFGGSWYTTSVGAHQSSCQRYAEPNALFYTRGDTTFAFELASEVHTPMMELLEKQDGATKLDWFRRNGKLIANANGSESAVKVASQ